MPGTENYQTEISDYDVMAFKSFINKTNLGPNVLPAVADSLFYDQTKAKSFFLETMLYLHLYNGILIELIKYTKNTNNDVALWKQLIQNLQIQINDGTTGTDKKIITLNTQTKTITLSLAAFSTNYLNEGYTDDDGYNLGSYNTNEYFINLLPVIKNDIRTDASSGGSGTRISQFTADFGGLLATPATVLNFIDSTQSAGTSSLGPYTKDGLDPSVAYTADKQTLYKLQSVIKEILNTPYTNILGYLLFYKIYYNIILFNIQIVEYVRTYYLLNANLRSTSVTRVTVGEEPTVTPINIDSVTTTLFDAAIASPPTAAGAGYYVVQKINLIFNEKKIQLDTLKRRIFNDKNAADTFDKNKWLYTNQIMSLNQINDDLKLNENRLNIALREYNKYTKNFNNIRSYATYVIIFLIVIILVTIAITIISGISNEFKNFYYLITFFILGIVTYLYYDKYNHVGLYEDFVVIANSASNTAAITPVSPSSTANMQARITEIYNKILTNMNNYNRSITEIFEKLRDHIYTIGNDIFYKDGSVYLYKTYMQKKKQFEANRIRLVGTLNSIEIMKKYVKYLFNIILLMSLLTLILIFGLLLFVNLPFFVVYIIIFCAILIIIVSITFINTITRPTRMIANKNYWADMTAKTPYIKKLR